MARTTGHAIGALMCFLAASHAEAQGWKRTVSLPAGPMYVDELEATADGVALVGAVNNSTLTRVLARLDHTGNVRWSRETALLSSSYRAAMTATADGGIVVVGSVYQPGSFRSSAVIMKLDDGGAVVWQRQWGVAPDSHGARDIVTLADGSFVVSGSGNFDGTAIVPGWLARFDGDGNRLWWRMYGDGVGFFSALIATSDGGLLAVGRRTGASPERDLGVIKLGASGVVEWERQITEATAFLGVESVAETPDGGYVIAGQSSVFPTSTSWIIKVDGTGAVQWSRFLDNTSGWYHFAADLVALPDGALLFRESRRGVDPPGPIPPNLDGRLWKFDPSGNPLAVAHIGTGFALLRKGTRIYTTDGTESANSIVEFDASAFGCLGTSSAPPPTTVPVLASVTTTPVVTDLTPPASPSTVTVTDAALATPLSCGTPPLVGSPGLHDPVNSTFHLRNALTSGATDVFVEYGPPAFGWRPVTGDWDGNGTDTVGLYDPAGGAFYLRNSNTSGFADVVVAFGPPGAPWLPIAGDWDGDGTVTIGLYDPQNAVWYLRNSLTSGVADVTFAYGRGGAGWIPVVGRWSASNTRSVVGLYDPAGSTFYLAGSNATGFAAITFTYGPAGAGWAPAAGDWDGDGITSVALFDPENARWFARNANTSGFADVTFEFGPSNAGWIPLAGDWNGR